MSAQIYLILAVLFFAHGVMMFILMHTMCKELPHARRIAVLYVLGNGALALGTVLQFLSISFGLSPLLSALLLVLIVSGFGIALITPIATTVWLIQDRNEYKQQPRHAA